MSWLKGESVHNKIRIRIEVADNIHHEVRGPLFTHLYNPMYVSLKGIMSEMMQRAGYELA